MGVPTNATSLAVRSRPMVCLRAYNSAVILSISPLIAISVFGDSAVKTEPPSDRLSMGLAVGVGTPALPAECTTSTDRWWVLVSASLIEGRPPIRWYTSSSTLASLCRPCFIATSAPSNASMALFRDTFVLTTTFFSRTTSRAASSTFVKSRASASCSFRHLSSRLSSFPGTLLPIVSRLNGRCPGLLPREPPDSGSRSSVWIFPLLLVPLERSAPDRG